MANEDISQASIPELISGVVGDAKDIATGHAGKMRDEIKSEFSGLKMYLMKIAVAVGIGVLGAILLAQAFALGLAAIGIPEWASYLISAAVFLGAGALVVKSLPSSSKEIDLIPEESFNDLKRDIDVIKHEVTA